MSRTPLNSELKGITTVTALSAAVLASWQMFEQLMSQGAVKRPIFGRPRIRPERVVGDKGYSSINIRCYLQRRGIRLTIPRRSNERRCGKFDKSIYRQRNRVERCFNRLKQFRRIATRYEKRSDN